MGVSPKKRQVSESPWLKWESVKTLNAGSKSWRSLFFKTGERKWGRGKTMQSRREREEREITKLDCEKWIQCQLLCNWCTNFELWVPSYVESMWTLSLHGCATVWLLSYCHPNPTTRCWSVCFLPLLWTSVSSTSLNRPLHLCHRLCHN